MQLKSLANTTNAIHEISALLYNTTLDLAEQDVALAAIGEAYTLETVKAAIAQSTLNQTQMEAILIANGLQGELLETTVNELVLAQAQKKVTASTLGLGTALKGLGLKLKKVAASLWAFLTTNPMGWLALFAGVFAFAAVCVKKHNDKLEEIKQKTKETAEEARSAADSIRSDFDSLSSTTDKIKRRYAELAQEVENLGKVNQSRGTLSTEDYNEFLDLSSQLAGLFPQLTAGYDENGNSLLSLSGNIDTIVSSLNDLMDVQQKISEQQILEKMSDIWAGYTLDAEEYKKALTDAQEMSDSTIKAISQMDSTRTITYDTISNGFYQHKTEELNTLISETLAELGIGNAGNDWNGTFQIHSSEFNPDIEGIDTHRTTWDLSSLSEEQFNLLQTRLGILSSKYEDSVMLARSRMEAADAELSAYLNTWLSLDPIYKNMDSGLQDAARAILFDTKWDEILPDNIDTDDWDAVSTWIQENFLYNISKVRKDPQIAKALSEVFTNAELTPPEKDGYLKQLQEYFGEDSVLTTVLQPRLEEAEELQSRYQDAISRFGEDSRDLLADFFQNHSINSSEEIDYWNKVTDSAQNTAEAVTLYRKSITAPLTPADPSQTIDQLNTRLKPALDSLGSAYRDIFADGGFNPDAVDLSMLESIKSSIEGLNNLQDVDINIDMVAFDSLATTLTSAGVTQQQAQQAFDDFATSVFYATTATEGMTDETKELVEQMLESLGVANAAEVTEYALAEAKAQNILASQDLAMASAADASAKEDEFRAILAEGVAAGLTRQQIYRLTAAEIAYGQNGLNTEGRIEQLRNLAAAYGDTANAALATAIANDIASGHADADAALSELMERINEGMGKVEIDFSGLEHSAAKAGKEAGKSYADALKDELSQLNSVIGYVGSILDDQIDRFNDQKDAAVEALEAEKEAAEEALEAEKALIQEQIDAKQAEIDKIEEASRARKDEIDLQQKQYNLERLRNQKTILQYSEGKGMHYAADTKEIREAAEAVTEAKENLRIAGIEKEISGLNDTLDSLDRKIEASSEYYDSLIEETEKYWDSLIRGLEDYKSRWQELSGIEEQAKMEAALRNLGIATDDILGMSESAFQSFKDNYLGILREIYSGNDDILNILQEIGGISADTLRPLAGDINHIADSIRNVSGSISGTAGTSPGSRTGDASGQSPDSAGQSPGSSLTGSIETLGETTEETLGEPDGDGVTGKFSELGQTIGEAESHVAGIIGSMEDLNGMTAECTITIHIETTGGIPDYASGTGIADAVSSIGSGVGGVTSKGKGTANTGTKIRGSASVTGSWDIREAGRTLVGELGQELWVHAKDGTFETVGDSGAEFIRTEKGDLIFNHLQTRELLSKGRLTGRGNPSAASTARTAGNIPVSGSPAPADAGELTSRGFPADGNLPAVSGSHKAGEDIIITGDGTVLLPYDPDKDPTPFGDAFRKWHAHMAKLNEQEAEDFLKFDTASERNRQMLETINQISNTSIITQNNRPSINVGDINISCPGVTSQAVMREVKTALNREFSGFYNYADQWIRR